MSLWSMIIYFKFMLGVNCSVDFLSSIWYWIYKIIIYKDGPKHLQHDDE